MSASVKYRFLWKVDTTPKNFLKVNKILWELRGLKWIKVWQQFLYLKKNGNDRVPLEIHVHVYNNGLNLRINLISLVYLQPVFVFWWCDFVDTLGYRMNPYGCIATGREEGMIEIVTNSMTISKIQRWYKKGAFAKEALYEWLKHKNPKEERWVCFILYLKRICCILDFLYWNILV